MLAGTAAGLALPDGGFDARCWALEAVSRSGALSGSTRGRGGVLGARVGVGVLLFFRIDGIPDARAFARASVRNATPLSLLPSLLAERWLDPGGDFVDSTR